MRATKEDARAAILALDRVSEGRGGPVEQESDLYLIRGVLVRCLHGLPTTEAVVRDQQRRRSQRRVIQIGGDHGQ